MSARGPMVGIDVGSAKVSVLVAIPDGDELHVLGCGQARHDGARKGVIANLADVTEAISAAADEAEAMATTPVELAAVGIGGAPVQGVRSTASVPITGRDRTVTDEDQRRALAACAQFNLPPDYRVLDIIPCDFAVDGHDGVEKPVGLAGSRLDASAYVVYTANTHAECVEQAVNRAAVAVKQLVYEPLAASDAVLMPDERELGCLLLDVGFASSEWVLLSEGAVLACGAVPVGGRHFTSDLATMLNTNTAAAEQLKRQVGASLSREGLDERAVEVPSLGGNGNQIHPARFAAEVLHERARDLLVGVHRALVEEGLDKVPRAGLVLTGGGARLDGLEELAEVIFGVRARVGTPRGLTGASEPVSGPEWAVACGLVRAQQQPRGPVLITQPPPGGLKAWLRRTLGELFELGGGT